ncbi:MAG: hypothetical protein ABIT58_04225 [Ferruginibacter sp.]
MSKKTNQGKADFVKLFLSSAENDINDVNAAKEFLVSEGLNPERIISEGLKKIKQMQLLATAQKTEEEMEASETIKTKAIKWVDALLNNINFSWTDIVRQEEISMNFRNMESLSKEDMRSILIRHFTLKFMNENDNDSQ